MGKTVAKPSKLYLFAECTMTNPTEPGEAISAEAPGNELFALVIMVVIVIVIPLSTHNRDIALRMHISVLRDGRLMTAKHARHSYMPHGAYCCAQGLTANLYN